MKKREIRSFLILVMALLTIYASSPAFSQGTPHWLDAIAERSALQQWLDAVEEMDRNDIFFIWGLNEKIHFINAMKDAGYNIDGELYSRLADDVLDTESRIAVANEIIDIHYQDAWCSYLHANTDLLSEIEPGALNTHIFFV